jgi:peptidoglycan hydrolase CwlO-like protein
VPVCTTDAWVIAVSDETVVETDGVTVSKFFNAEDFPVPAVAFEVSSSRDADVTLSITDEIPDEFGIDQIGFHPEYGSEHWTATGDGVVRFEREVAAGEEFTTVYGVRMENGQDETPFLSAPSVDVDGEDIDDVVPPESTDVVRELAGGERDTVPGLEDDDEDGLEAEVEVEAGAAAGTGDIDAVTDDAEILGDEGGLIDDDEENEADASDDADDVDPAVGDSGTEPLAAEEDGDSDPPSGTGSFGDEGDDEGTALDAGSSFGDDGDDEDGLGTSGSDVDASGTDLEAELEDDADDDTGPVGAAAGAGGFDEGEVAAALAEAIRNDQVADEDLETIQGALGGVPQSTEVEIDHLQSRVSELEAYTDALEAFIDENGPAQEVLSEFEDDVEDLENELADVHADVASVEESLADADEDREALWTEVEEVQSKAGAVDDLEESLERLRGDVDALDERLADTEEDVLALADVEDDIESLEDDLDDVEETVEEIDEWRDQLSDVFGA